MTESGAFWGIVAGFVVNVGMNAMSMAAGEMAGAGGSDSDRRHQQLRCDTLGIEQGHVTQNEVDYRTLLHHMPTSEREPQAVRQTLVWAKVMVLAGMGITASLAFFYALPYPERYKLSRSNPGSAQVSGEMLAIAYGVVLTASGLWIWRQVLKDYGADGDE